MLLELQVQVGVREAARTPMLERNNISWLWFEFGAELAAPLPVFEALVHPRGLLHRRDVLPGLVVTRTVSMMDRIEHAQSCVPRRPQDPPHMRDAVVGLGDLLHAIPKLSA